MLLLVVVALLHVASGGDYQAEPLHPGWLEAHQHMIDEELAADRRFIFIVGSPRSVRKRPIKRKYCVSRLDAKINK